MYIYAFNVHAPTVHLSREDGYVFYLFRQCITEYVPTRSTVFM
jgi:hypothetical protein